MWRKIVDEESERERKKRENEKAAGEMVGLILDACECIFLGYFIYELFHLSSAF